MIAICKDPEDNDYISIDKEYFVFNLCEIEEEPYIEIIDDIGERMLYAKRMFDVEGQGA